MIANAFGVWGPELEASLYARSQLVDWTGRAGDAARARDQLAALLPIMERVLGREHLDTLTARSHLADWTGRRRRQRLHRVK
jgi:hypothetical protein